MLSAEARKKLVSARRGKFNLMSDAVFKTYFYLSEFRIPGVFCTVSSLEERLFGKKER